jgi:hypothetical protein
MLSLGLLKISEENNNSEVDYLEKTMFLYNVVQFALKKQMQVIILLTLRLSNI